MAVGAEAALRSGHGGRWALCPAVEKGSKQIQMVYAERSDIPSGDGPGQSLGQPSQCYTPALRPAGWSPAGRRRRLRCAESRIPPPVALRRAPSRAGVPWHRQ